MNKSVTNRVKTKQMLDQRSMHSSISSSQSGRHQRTQEHAMSKVRSSFKALPPPSPSNSVMAMSEQQPKDAASITMSNA